MRFRFRGAPLGLLLVPLGATALAHTGMASRPGPPELSGALETSVSVAPLSCAAGHCEETTVLFTELGADLELALELDRLTIASESAMGMAGLQSASLMLALDLEIRLVQEVVFAMPYGRRRLPDGRWISVTVPPRALLPVRSQAEIMWPLEGAEIRVLAVAADVNFPNPRASPPPSYGPNAQSFRFGTAIAVKGETDQGVRLKGIIGFCLDPKRSSPIIGRGLTGRVCEDGRLTIERSLSEIRDLPVLHGLSTDHRLECRPDTEPPGRSCDLKSELEMRPPPGPLDEASVEVEFDPVYPRVELDDVELELGAGPLELKSTFDPALRLERIGAGADWTLRPGGAGLKLDADVSTTLIPGEGLTRLRFRLGLSRERQELKATVAFRRSGNELRWDASRVELELSGGVLDAELRGKVGPEGLDGITVKTELPF